MFPFLFSLFIHTFIPILFLFFLLSIFTFLFCIFIFPIPFLFFCLSLFYFFILSICLHIHFSFLCSQMMKIGSLTFYQKSTYSDNLKKYYIILIREHFICVIIEVIKCSFCVFSKLLINSLLNIIYIVNIITFDM